LRSLKYASVRNLSKIAILLTYDHGFLSNVVDLLRRNRNTLVELDIRLKWRVEPKPMTFDHVDSLIPNIPPYHSCLIDLILTDLELTRESFSVLMGGCPLLQYVKLYGCQFIPDQTMVYVKNYRVNQLVASISQVMSPDSDSFEPTSSQSLLVHFPNLEKWEIEGTVSEMDDELAEDLGVQLETYCPLLVGISTYAISGDVLYKLLRKSFSSIKKICFKYENITPNVILGLLLHQSTLETINVYNPLVFDSKGYLWRSEADRVYLISDKFSEGWMIQMLPSSCPHLTVIALPGHEMEMDLAERLIWVCKDLQELQIRIKGLDTKDLIMSAINKWLQAKQRILTDGENAGENIKLSSTIEDRVVRHLLQFKKLKTVWLGYKTWVAA
ncbi:hypothetical protein BGX27_009512, partial [Mortierella sp. AM989]